MDKSGLLLGGIFGAAVAVVAFAIVMVPPLEQPPPVIVEQGSTAVAQAPSTEGFDRLTLVQIFERSEPGVVKINVKRNMPDLVRGGVGSGFVYDTQGHVITNAHVIDDAREVVVTFLDGRSYEARVVGADPDTDIAVIRVDESRSLLSPLAMGRSAGLKVGEQIAAIGNPFGLSGSMTSGIVSQMGRLLPQESGFSIPDIIQTDAAINPGNSGGPLLNMRGEVVGINTAIQSATGEFTGVGFAVPADTVRKIVPVLIDEGRYEHPWIGIRGTDIGPDLARILGLADTKGFLIIGVTDGSPAAKAGLEGSTETVERDGDEYRIGGDVILGVDGKDVRKIDDILIHLQREKSVGDVMVLDVLRDGRTASFEVVLEGRPE